MSKKTVFAPASAAVSYAALAIDLVMLPENGATVPLLNDGQKAFFGSSDEFRRAAFTSAVTRTKWVESGWHPRPVTFVWDGIATRKDYEAEKTCYGAQDGVLAHWQNEEVGDPAFYASVLKPVVERLDAAAAKVTFEMDDATVDELERTALPAWYNFRFDVQRLRADYLRKSLTKTKRE